MRKDINRRSFLKLLGGGAVASSALLAACKQEKENKDGRGEPPKDKMTMRVNPNTGDKVSLLGYGMMRLPMEGGADMKDNQDAPIDQEMVNRQVDYAIEHGVNYFDTSPAYCRGLSEKATGIALSRHKRSEYFIATKMSNFSPESQSRQGSQEIFENSLKELQVDYIDYLLLHAIGGGNDALETFNTRFMDNGILDWLVEQKKKGRIRNLGFSYHGDVSIYDMLLKWHDEGRYHWDFVQIELNYLDWNYADEINPRNTDAVYLYGELQKRGIPAVIMEPLLGGRLANVPDPIVEKMKAKRHEDSVASWAFRFANEEENGFLMEIAKDIYDLKTIPCNECNYCMPCPYGINIPAIFSHYNKCIKEGNMPRHLEDSEYARQRRAFLIGYDRSVPRLRQANHCIGCGQCVEHCPQRIDIPKEMRKIDEFVESMKDPMQTLKKAQEAIE